MPIPGTSGNATRPPSTLIPSAKPPKGWKMPVQNCIVWNLFRDGTPDGEASAAADATVIISTASYSTVNRPQNLLFGWNRIQDSTNVAHYQNKVGGNTSIYNTIKDCTGAYSFTCRHGTDNYIGGNWINTNARITIRGRNHTVIGNHLPNSRIEADPGNIPNGSAGEPTWFTETGTKGWTYAEDAKLIGNECAIQVDGIDPRPPFNYTPLRTLIEDHTGSVTISSEARQTIDRRNEAASQMVPVAFELLASEVGPNS